MNVPPPTVQSPFPAGQKIRISVPDQRLDLLDGTDLVVSYPISTSKFGLGSEPGSFRTPTGHFRIDEMIGHGVPERAIFRSRRPTGELAPLGGDDDHVLTRILWLTGIDPGNANTRDRYIYIHGTNQEAAIGTAASHGCVRMRNTDIISLFEKISPGISVEILPELLE